MKKFILSFTVVIASALYVIFGTRNIAPVAQIATTSSQPANNQTNSTVLRSSSNQLVTTTPKPSPTPTPTPSSTPKPVPTPKGQYINGSYTGNVADAYYGMVQVKAVVQNGRLANVQFLQYPSDRSTSRYINGQAMPYLIQEAIQAQSANVDTVSGASDTSAAFIQSLASALSQAKNI